MNDTFATLARYHRWATSRLLSAIEPVDDDTYRRDLGLFFGSIHGTLNHLIVADRLWHTRFHDGLSPVVELDAEVSASRPEVARLLLDDVGRWRPLVASIAGRHPACLSYRTMRGKDVSLPFDATLAHVFNHGTHHRGQLTAALSIVGAKTPELDLVFMLQQESDGVVTAPASAPPAATGGPR